jgi:methyl-accepting chemotaxis protein
VNEAIQQLDKVIQQNASASDEMSATSAALSGQADTLQRSIAFFRIGGEDEAAPAKKPIAPQTATGPAKGKAQAKTAQPARRLPPVPRKAAGGRERRFIPQ